MKKKEEMKWQYPIAVFLLLLSQLIFYGSIYYYAGSDVFYWVFNIPWVMGAVAIFIIAVIIFFYGMFEDYFKTGEEEWI